MKRLSSFLFLAFSALCCVPMGAKGETTTFSITKGADISGGSFTANGITTTFEYEWEAKSYFNSNGGQAAVGSANNPASSVVATIPADAFASAPITSVSVTTRGPTGIAATVGVTVGGQTYYCEDSETAPLTTTSTTYTFQPSETCASGEIVITWVNSSAKALYIGGFSVETGKVNVAPTITLNNGDAYTADVGHELTILFTAEDTNEGDTLTVTVAENGVAIGSVSGGVFTWTPTMVDLGEHTLDFTVTDGEGETDTATATVTVQVGAVRDLVLGDASKNSFSVSFTPETWAEEYTLSIVSRGYDADTLIEEAWDKVTSASQSAITADQYNNATYTQVPGWSGERAYRYYVEGDASSGAIRIGNTSTAGYIQTPAFENLALGTTLKVSCKAKTQDNKASLRISTRRANGSERDAREFYSESKETELDLTGENAVLLTAGAGDRVMFQVVSPNKSQRIVIDDIVVEEIPMDARTVTVSGSPYTVENALPGRRYAVSVVATDGTHSSGPATADIILPKAKVGTALTIF